MSISSKQKQSNAQCTSRLNFLRTTTLLLALPAVCTRTLIYSYLRRSSESAPFNTTINVMKDGIGNYTDDMSPEITMGGNYNNHRNNSTNIEDSGGDEALILSPPINDTMSVNSDEVEPFVNRWQRRFTDSERRLVLSAKNDKYCVNAS